MTAKKTLADGHEQCERNQAVGKGSVGGTRQPTQIGASPDEFVPFGANDPGAVIVKLELGLDLGRDFDCEGTALRRAAGYPQHRHMRQRRKVGPSSPRRARQMLSDSGQGQVKEAPNRSLKLGLDVREFL